MEFKPPKKLAHRSVKKVDALVTGLILWGIVASIYGLERHCHKTSEEISENTQKSPVPTGTSGWKKVITMLIFGVPEEKPSLWKRIISRFRNR